MTINTNIPRDLALPDKKKVFIIYGRNIQAKISIEHFVKALGLSPIDFVQLAATGGSQFVGDIVRSGMKQAQGIIALFTPDEVAELGPQYVEKNDRGADKKRCQARPNVIFEAGLAYGIAPERTIIVTIGSDVALFSDLNGLHIVKLDNDRDSRGNLRKKLIGVECAVDTVTDAWIDPRSSGDFESCLNFEAASRHSELVGNSQQIQPVPSDRDTVLTEDEYIGLLSSWFENLRPDQRTIIEYAQTDKSLKLPSGTTQKFIVKVAKEHHYEVTNQGPSLVRFKFAGMKPKLFNVF